MSATRKDFCNNLWCDSASDLPASGQWTGQIAFIADSPVVVKRWNGSSWIDVTPTFGSGSGRYDPDREPAEVDPDCSDNFIGGSQLSWRWGNQGSSTDTDEMDEATLTPEAASGNNRRCRWIDAPQSADFCTTMKFSAEYLDDHNQQGIVLLSTGSEATPTKLWMGGIIGSSGGKVYMTSATSYTAANSGGAESRIYTFGLGVWAMPYWYLQFRYDTSSKELRFFYSTNGFGWRQVGSTETLANDPISIGRFCNPDNVSAAAINRCYWFRTFTSGVASATSAQYADGQVGS